MCRLQNCIFEVNAESKLRLSIDNSIQDHNRDSSGILSGSDGASDSGETQMVCGEPPPPSDTGRGARPQGLPLHIHLR